ncbi:GntP family permease [Rhodobacter capsulatus]|uniref:GntP family permease n=1 Tax=Rhodobacter capsulatus TaxID=1061 RepID=UPI0006DC40D8|nr:GntP family permease [Rhodobacter capsulatus]KQB13934.1 transporter [Rhodobacter capsulatus]KQB14364.1 transporter [Rhodobacter capsulatus]PZX23360.1 H+/gluconate symporter-like permease [Rhodobacter capsulatus]QNR64796.1 GntP family permease [Rhodobacter capsulatus]
MIGILVILLALGALIYFAYRGLSLLLLAPAMAMLAVLFAEGGPLLASYTQIFMQATGGFIIQYFPLFLLGAVFGKLMEASGSARVLADGIIRGLGPSRAILAVILSCAAMTYGGVSLFVVAFAVWPIASALFREADLPRMLIPATIALGAFTFTMTALPGTPAIQNAIPMPYFGTTPFAAPGLGLITGALMLGLGWGWLEYRARALGPGYGDLSEIDPEPETGDAPGLAVAAAPLLLVLALNLGFTFLVIPAMDTGYLALPEFGATDADALRGVWSIIAALTLASLALVGMNWRRLATGLSETLDDGARNALKPIFNTASLVGFGAVIASLSAFGLIRDWVVTVGGDNPLISLAVGTSLLAGMTGSASGGMSIALSTLGETYLAMGQAAGVSPDLLHRVTAVATGGLDALPHNGAVITLLTICGLTHREAYRDIFVVAVAIPVVALVVLVVSGTMLGSF